MVDERNEREPAEGVRIIGAKEAQEALEAGAATGRRPDDELRFGDVPPAPSGPRPQHRFPLPDSVDPAAAVPRSRVAAGRRGEGSRRSRRGARSEQVEKPEAANQANEEPGPVPEAPGQVAEAPAPAADAAGAPGQAAEAAAPPAMGDDATGPGVLPAQPPVEWRAPEESPEESAQTMSENRPSSAPSWAAGPEPGSESVGYEPSPTFGRGSRLGLYEDDDAFASSHPGALPGEPPPPDLALPRLDLPSPGEVAGAPPEPPPPAQPAERITLSGHEGPELPHWTDPPTGEVPRILVGSDAIDEDDLGAWQALGTRGTRWRDEAGDWDDVEDMQNLASEEVRVGALDTTRAEHSDLYSFDADFERLEEERSGAHPVVSIDQPEEEPVFEAPPPPAEAQAPRRPAPPRRPVNRPPTGGGPRDVGTAVAVGAGMIIALLVAYVIGSTVLVVVAAAVVGACAAEGYGMLQRAGFRPATLLGLVASVGIVFAAYWKGPLALPLVIALTFAAAMVWYLWGIVDARPLANVAVTVMIFVWVGVLGSFSALLLQVHDGRGLFLGAVITAVAADIAAYFAGSQVGSRPIAPTVSPGKTWEGTIAGLVAALVVGAVIGKTVDPWGGIKHGIVLGLLVGIVAPLGDLAESMVKRDLGIKDSGGVLPGHGGLLDRFDSVLLALPTAYYLAHWVGIVKV